ncbi:hypothetical protein GCM10010915_10980 [Microbacterium faecale]|uniref:Uncharacterized protein n=1 Tax=Microbacterium faecale TaxID=1804630 RepID=A0A916Y6P4_9MICO|nr:hypothetical protein [Microbacterium faecale]GGD32441.1 hypothetical protein GCM10010915_10980 [Microbacterium faecale]
MLEFLAGVDVFALEMFFLGLLGLASVAIAFVSGAVLLNLFRGQK